MCLDGWTDGPTDGLTDRQTDRQVGRRVDGWMEGNVLFNDALITFNYGYMASDRIAHTTALVTPVVEHLAGTRNSSMDPPHEGSIRRPIAP